MDDMERPIHPLGGVGPSQWPAGERIKKGDAVYLDKRNKIWRCKKFKWYQCKLFYKIFKNKYRE